MRWHLLHYLAGGVAFFLARPSFLTPHVLFSGPSRLSQTLLRLPFTKAERGLHYSEFVSQFCCHSINYHNMFSHLEIKCASHRIKRHNRKCSCKLPTCEDNYRCEILLGGNKRNKKEPFSDVEAAPVLHWFHCFCQICSLKPDVNQFYCQHLGELKTNRSSRASAVSGFLFWRDLFKSPVTFHFSQCSFSCNSSLQLTGLR